MVLAALLVLLAPLESAAQSYTGCLTFVKNLKTTASCIGEPGFDKYFEATKVHWTDGTPYLVVNTGNDLDFFDISTPRNPTSATGSNFWHWGFNLGDSDYDLINYTLCDGCRYGMSNYKLGTFLYDLGTGGEPQFSSTAYMYDPVIYGASAGFTFSHAGSQYIIGTDLTMGSCANGIPVYRMTGVTPGSLTKAGCVPLADAPVGWGVQNGIELAGDYVGLANSTGTMLVFQVAGSGTSLSFTQVDPLLLGGVGRNVGSVADLTLELALLTKVGQPARLYSLSDSAPPATLLNEHSANANLAALGGGILFVSRAYYPGSEVLYKIDDFIHSPSPPALSPDFWSDAWSWNQNECEKPTGAVVSDDGSTLYTTNYSVVKVIDAIPCGVPVQPIANFVISPANAFPADDVTVTNTSSGGSRTAIWVTDTSDPSSTLRFGSRAMSESTTPLTFTVPQNLPASQDYWAHVAVENDDFLCDPVADPEGCGNQLATKHVLIDRTPLVTGIGYEPAAPLRDETVTFSATAEGTPSSWTWDVVSPGGVHTTGSGNPMVPTVHLNESDTWSATVTAHYLHSGGAYTDSETVDLDISSVSAAFTVPSNPLNTEPITLDGSSSRAAPSATPSYDWTVTGPTPYTACPHTELCTIPADTLAAGAYTVGLTLRDTSTGDSSTAPNQYMTVEDGAIYLDFNWAPASPQIGQLVAFNITGVSGDIDQADWDFGDIGCRGFDQLTTCTPMFFPYCMTQSYRFASSGPKIVTVTVTIDGEQYTSPPHTVTVQATGVCAEPPCTYDVAPTTFSLPFTGSSGTVQVTTDADCTWQAVANAPWLHITAGSSGTGDGDVDFTADPNPGEARSGTLTVAGHTVTVTQPAFVVIDFTWYPAQPERGQAVTFAVSPEMEPLSWDFGSPDCAGRSQVVDCTSDPAACRTIQWTYPTDGPRDVTLTISSGDRTRTVSVQDQGACAGSCAYALSPGTRLLPASAGSAAFDIATGAGCPWTAASGQDWATITSALSGAGPATVTYHVTANAGAARAGTIAVAGLHHTVQQQDAYPPGDCTQAGPHDDGTFEDAYGWSEADTLVERYTPPAYPALYTGVCVAWTQSGGDQALDYDVVFMDDDGAGGGPGTVLGTAPGSAAGIPSWPDAVLVPDDVAGAAPPVTGGSVWVGVAWNDSADSGFSVAADESPTTAVNQGLFRQDAGPWLTIASQHPAYRALLVRPVAGAGPPGSPWEIVVGGPRGGGNGFGDAANASATAAAVFDDRLYVGATGADDHTAELWSSPDGISWTPAASPGFGDPLATAVGALAAFGDDLYAGGARDGSSQVWRSADGSDWDTSGSAGFGDAGNEIVQSLEVFDGFLYAGVGNGDGCELWRTSNGVAWSQVSGSGLGTPLALNLLALRAFGGDLYAGTDLGVWRSSDGVAWSQVLAHSGVSSLEAFGGDLYAGMLGGEVWRTADGLDWTQVMGGGFGDPDNVDVPRLLATTVSLYASLSNPEGGARIWRTGDGLDWTQASWGGFGDPGNQEIPSLALFHGDLYAGTGNPSGLEVWRLRRGDDDVLLWDGFESSDIGAWTDSEGSVAVVPDAAHTGDWGLELTVSSSCAADSEVVLSHQTVTGTVALEACSSITAGDAYTIADGGSATLTAGGAVVLGNGFSVLSGGRLTAALDASLDPAAFVEDASPSAQTTYNAELWVDLDDLTLGAGDHIVHLVATADDGAEALRLVITDDLDIVLGVRDDSGVLHTSAALPTSPGWNRVAFSWRAAAGATASLEVNGGSTQLTGLATASRRIDRVRWGVVSGDFGTGAGTIAMDDFYAWR